MDRPDPSFGLSPQALAILYYLVEREPEFAVYENGHYDIDVRTFPWYNGREKGVCLVFRRSLRDTRALHITFGEIRNHNGIFVDHWVADLPYNCPTPTSIDEESLEKAFQARKNFGYGRVGEAVDFIYELMERHYTGVLGNTDGGSLRGL